MSQRTRYAIGVLSGTSCDGVDAACCRVSGAASPSERFGYEVDVIEYVEQPYPDHVRDRLLRASDRETARIDEIARLDAELGYAFARAVDGIRETAGLDPDEIDVVGSHGHTVWHAPEPTPTPFHDRDVRATLQIGDPSVVTERTGISTAADFRGRDVAVGGHGAPLAPFIDAIWFGSTDSARAVQNIGGIGNCTILPPEASRSDIVAFDTGPGNMVIDAVVTIVTDGELTYDVDGELAAAGRVDDELVDAFLADEYFRREPPKTTGREVFGRDYAERFIEAGEGRTSADLVSSATMLTARSIADAYDRFADPYPEEVIVSGGGAYNPTLCEMLADELASPLATLDEYGIDPARKEAALFAALAVAHRDGVPGNVPSATGAAKPVVLGSLTPGAAE